MRTIWRTVMISAIPCYSVKSQDQPRNLVDSIHSLRKEATYINFHLLVKQFRKRKRQLMSYEQI